jgi:hypothetical protein
MAEETDYHNNSVNLNTTFVHNDPRPSLERTLLEHLFPKLPNI